jgi:myo-inositol-1(or 4)-monophosphatase
MHGELVVLGVVYNPTSDEMFWRKALAMGFPYDHGSQAFRRSLDNFVRVTTAAQATRRDGSTALSLCNVACGRYDGFIVEANSLWDYAAGVLLVWEAGGQVADFAGRDDVAGGASSQVVASNSVLHGSLLACVDQGTRLSA